MIDNGQAARTKWELQNLIKKHYGESMTQPIHFNFVISAVRDWNELPVGVEDTEREVRAGKV